MPMTPNSPVIPVKQRCMSVRMMPPTTWRRERCPITLGNGSGNTRPTAILEEKAVLGVFVSYKGGWPKPEQGQKNVNALHAGQNAGRVGNISVHSTLMTVSP